MKKFNIALTPEQAAKFLKSQCEDGGKDVVQHLLEIVGTNDTTLLEMIFNSMDSDFCPEGEFKVGEEHEILRYSDYISVKIKEIDRYSKFPIITDHNTYTAKKFAKLIQDAKDKRKDDLKGVTGPE